MSGLGLLCDGHHGTQDRQDQHGSCGHHSHRGVETSRTQTKQHPRPATEDQNLKYWWNRFLIRNQGNKSFKFWSQRHHHQRQHRHWPQKEE